MKKIITFAFIGILISGSLFLFLKPKESFSSDENRYLAQLPKFTFENIKSGEFMDDIEEFIVDQFPFRLSWIQLKTKSELALGKVDSNGVYITEQGYFIEKFTDYNKEQLEKNYTNLLVFNGRLKEKFNIELDVMLVPTASTILNHLLPSYSYDYNQIDLINELDKGQVNMIHLGEILLKHKEENIFYRTDHHWTSLGAYYAYQAYQTNTLPLDSYKQEILSNEFLGTLYSKVKVKPQEKDSILAYYLNDKQEVEYNWSGKKETSFYERSFLNKKDKYSVFFNGNQSITKIGGYGQSGKLLIIKDSYANAFAQFPMTDYEEVHLIDLRYFNMPIDSYIEKERITNVLVLYNFINFTNEKSLFMLNK